MLTEKQVQEKLDKLFELLTTGHEPVVVNERNRADLEELFELFQLKNESNPFLQDAMADLQEHYNLMSDQDKKDKMLLAILSLMYAIYPTAKTVNNKDRTYTPHDFYCDMDALFDTPREGAKRIANTALTAGILCLGLTVLTVGSIAVTAGAVVVSPYFLIAMAPLAALAVVGGIALFASENFRRGQFQFFQPSFELQACEDIYKGLRFHR